MTKDSHLTSCGILCSSGIESRALIYELSKGYDQVFPIYIRQGYLWEQSELVHLQAWLKLNLVAKLRGLVILDSPALDCHPEHWSLTGINVPDENSEDEEVFLPGRNLAMITKASLWCRSRNIHDLAIGILKNNPFPDSTSHFFSQLETLIETESGHPFRILRPFAQYDKKEVLSKLPREGLSHTFSCIRPRQYRHCLACNKCAERSAAFVQIGIEDPETLTICP